MLLTLMPQEPTGSGFEWSSDSDEAIGRTLYFGLAGYFTVTEMQLLFPVGDTYKFNLSIYNSLDGTGEPYVVAMVRPVFVGVYLCVVFYGWPVIPALLFDL